MKSSKQPLNGLSILFADDEESLQELMSMELPRMGHRVTVCPDGNTATMVLAKETFDCVSVDLDMPGMNVSKSFVVRRRFRLRPKQSC